MILGEGDVSRAETLRKMSIENFYAKRLAWEDYQKMKAEAIEKANKSI